MNNLSTFEYLFPQSRFDSEAVLLLKTLYTLSEMIEEKQKKSQASDKCQIVRKKRRKINHL